MSNIDQLFLDESSLNFGESNDFDLMNGGAKRRKGSSRKGSKKGF